MSEAPCTSRYGWLQFSLRSLLLVAALIAIPFGVRVNRVHHQRAVVGLLRNPDDVVHFDYQCTYMGVDRASFDFAIPSPGPSWLKRLLGDDFFANIIQIRIQQTHNPDEAKEVLAHLPYLPYLVSLSLSSDEITDEHLTLVAGIRSLEGLGLEAPKISEAGLAHLADLHRLTGLAVFGACIDDVGIYNICRLKQLQGLDFTAGELTEQQCKEIAHLKRLEGLGIFGSVADSGLFHLAQLKSLTRLDFDGELIGDLGLEYVSHLNELERLSMTGLVDVSDEGLLHLKGLHKLQYLCLFTQQRATNKGVSDLRNALPNCEFDLYLYEE